MPFASEEQRRFLWWAHPRIAARWEAEEKRGPGFVGPRTFPNLAQGLVGVSDRVLADHLALYARACDELARLTAAAPRVRWNAPPGLPEEVVERVLATPVRDLGLAIEGRLGEALDQLRGELVAKGITWWPGFYLGDGDFWTTDQATSVNLPWYLANDTLWDLVNGNYARYDLPDLMRTLRHEAGHAVGYAFEVWREELWRMAFGDFRAPYLDAYVPDPALADDYVRNLHDSVSAPNLHYAQKHPDEDWAETFAVWLDPGSRWRETYPEGTKARAKLETVQILLADWGRAYGKPVNTRVGRRVPYTDLPYTVGEFLGASDAPDPAAGARRRLPEVYDSVVLHEAYFGGFGRDAASHVVLGPRLQGFLEASFGSYDAWRADHREAARAAGDGWVLTVWDPRDSRIRNVLVRGHGDGVPAACPILAALDMHEHSYAGDYGIRSANYVAAWWQNLDLAVVGSRLDLASPPPPAPEPLPAPEPA